MLMTLGLFSCNGQENGNSTTSEKNSEDNKPAIEEKTEETTIKGSIVKDHSYAHHGVTFEQEGIHYKILNQNSVYLDEHESHKNISGGLVIPSTVTYNNTKYYVVAIGDDAFKSNPYLTSVVIPNSVKFIYEEAFENCYNLSSVTLPNELIGLDATVFNNTPFFNNEAKWENGVLYLGAYLLKAQNMSHCSIKEGTKCIADHAFSECESLTSITIPNSVKHIGYRVFSATNVSYPIFNAHCFAYMPPSFEGYFAIPDGIQNIAGGAFSECSILTSVTIPESVTSIGYCAFSGCSSLTSITIPNSVKTIEHSVFSSCSSLTSVIIPNSVTSIGDYAFYNCSSLNSIFIPNSVTSIGNYAFGECTTLTTVTVPSHAKIEKGAFPEYTEVIRY